MSNTTDRPSLEDKRNQAKAYLGPNWVLHPDYQFNPRHSNDPVLYDRARQPFLRRVGEAAASARAARSSTHS